MNIPLTKHQLDSIRRRVREGMEDIKAGRFTEYEGREGLKKLADEVKARSRRLLAKRTSRKQYLTVVDVLRGAFLVCGHHDRKTKMASEPFPR